jgi:Protein of unknown function (DUF3800)
MINSRFSSEQNSRSYLQIIRPERRQDDIGKYLLWRDFIKSVELRLFPQKRIIPPLEEREYILFCDESDRDGEFFSSFYGGLLVGATQYQPVTDRLNVEKRKLNLHQEVKWRKVTEIYLPKYESLMHAFFDELEAGRVKIRIMFRQNAQQPTGLTAEQKELSYWLLYYQFVKHAFGFDLMPRREEETHLRLFFDRFPDTTEKSARFKGFIEALAALPGFRKVGLKIRRHDIAEIDSHDHVLLQCLDIVLGAICFRLNDKHKKKPRGLRLRGSRTIAKEKLYKLINQRICRIKPNFNIGVTTGGGPQCRWELSYCHWKFVPSIHNYDGKMTKRGRKKKPT